MNGPPKHVCHITTAHPWSDTRIFARMCVGLHSLGHRVTLVAPVKAPFEERGVSVVPTGLAGKAARVMGARALFPRLDALAADIYHFHDPELLPPMSLFRRRTGHRVVYDVHEYYPESVIDSNYFGWRPLSRLAGGVFGAVEPVLGRRLDAVVGVTDPITERFAGGRARLLTVRNLPSLDFLGAVPPPVELPSRQTLVIGGVMDRNRLASEVIDALALLAPRWDDLQLLLIGDLVDDPYGAELRARAEGKNVGARVTFRPRMSWPALQAHLASSPVGLVLLADRQNNRWALPTRTFEFMAQGVPVVATDFPQLREVIGGAGCGLLLPDAAPRTIADAVHYLLSNPDEARAMGERGREAIRSRFNWTTELDALDRLYAEL